MRTEKDKNRNWGGKRTQIKIYKYHEKWAKKNGYRETSNEELHAKNSERFVNHG